MAATIANITFACEAPEKLARFWQEALGYEWQVAPPEFLEAWKAAGRDPDGAAAIVDPTGKSPRFFFLRMKKRPEVEGTSLPLHLDLQVKDRETEVKRLVELGATVVETKTRVTGPYTETWTELRDPEGNGFCIQ